MAAEYRPLYLNVHGVGVQIDSELPTWSEEIEHDFSYFRRTSLPASVKKHAFRLSLSTTQKKRLPWIPALRIGKTQFFFAPFGESRYRLFEKAWVSYHFRKRRASIFCDDLKVGYEVCYLLLLSHLGERLDRKGWHRIHGLGIEGNRRGAIVLGASGTGKSTLAMTMLTKRASRMRLLSDDTPLVGRRRKMLAFPQRIALRELPDISPRFVRKFSRVDYGEKFVVGGQFFKQRVRQECELSWLLLGSRGDQRRSKIQEVSRWKALWPLFKWLIVGYETPQVWEFYLRPDPLDWVAKTGIAGRRFKAAAQLFQNCRTATFDLSNDPVESFESLEAFLSEKKGVGSCPTAPQV